MESFNTKVNKAAAMFLDRRGYEIIDEPWKREGGMLPVDIVARDEETIVFVSTRGKNIESGAHFEDASLDRDKLEAFAVNWFSDNAEELDENPFRFDAISILVMGDDAKKALLRHHINALSVSWVMEGPKTSDPSEEEARETTRAA